MAPICIVVVALTLVAQVSGKAVEGSNANEGDACMCEDGSNGTYATSVSSTAVPATTAAPATTTAAAPATTLAAASNSTTAAAAATANASNSSNSSRRLGALEFDEDLFDDDVFGAPARKLEEHLECVCPTAAVATTTASATSPSSSSTAAAADTVIAGELAIDFGSARRLGATDFLARARKLLEATDVQPHIEAGLKNSTGQSSAKVTACVKQGSTDVFNTKYEIEMESGSDITGVVTKLSNIAKAGVDFEMFKAAVWVSAQAAGLNLTIAAPPTVLSEPAVTMGSVTNATTASPSAQLDAACPHGVLSAVVLALMASLAFLQ